MGEEEGGERARDFTPPLLLPSPPPPIEGEVEVELEAAAAVAAEMRRVSIIPARDAASWRAKGRVVEEGCSWGGGVGEEKGVGW